MFPDAETARIYMEKRLWPNGPTCPCCGLGERITTRKDGFYRCNQCQEDFTVRTGTIFERSHVPLHKWLYAMYLLVTARKGISSMQLAKEIGITQKSAWFVLHRIREACGKDLKKLQGIVEVDETYLGGKMRGRGRGYVGNKTPIVSLIERGGRVRSHVVDHVTGEAITKLLKEHVNEEAHLHTDESPLYTKVGQNFSSHETVNHSIEEYARTAEDGVRVTTNTAEGFFGNSKRSIDGTHHNISRKHTGLYFAELDHKYNTRKMTDGERTVVGIRRMEGKRLMYRASQRKAS
jgi:transposase-like protein